MLVDDDGRQLHVEAAHGLNRPSHHIQYTVGEGVIGKVVETGKAVIVPRVSKEPTLIFRATARDEDDGDESSFVCVPIGFDRRVVGALGVNLKFKADRNYDRSKAFFSVAASMIGQALKVQRLVAAQHKRLVNENAHLKQELRERYDFAGIVGNSGPMQRVYEQVAQVARTSTSVLLRGESGTGKELIAQRDSLQLRAGEEAVRQGELRRAARHADRVGALRLRERGLHRRRPAQEGAVRAGGGRHALPRRDRRRAARRRR